MKHTRIRPLFTHVAILSLAAALGPVAPNALGGDSAAMDLERQFSDTVRPFLESYCFPCHGKEKQKGKLDLSRHATAESALPDGRLWEAVLRRLEAGEMPPEEANRQPPAELRKSVIDWARKARRLEAERNAGDPGPVLARRLSNAEYDHTIRDLTGVDMMPTRELPVDPANEAGFDNSAESLAMSPTLLKKYLDAAREVAEHVVLMPRGFVFAPHPVVADTDRDKYCVQRIVDFYRRQPTDHADYFFAAWRFKNRAALERPGAAIADFAAEVRISSKYLATVWSALELERDEEGPLAALQAMWRELPGPGDSRDGAARRGCEAMREFVTSTRRKLRREFENLGAPGIAEGSQPFVLWKDRQYAESRMRCGDCAPKVEGQASAATGPARFCAVFPDAFYVAERGLIFLKEDKESRGRLLSAGFHLMFGYFRDDAPLSELVLDEPAKRELDALWDELQFVTAAPMRQYKDFVFFERAEPPRFLQGAEFDFARSEDRDVTGEAKIGRLAEAYLDKARRTGAGDPALGAIGEYFRSISAEIRKVEQAWLAAEPSHLEALAAFAERAYRRPLSQFEREELIAFYRSVRRENGLTHEEAIRDAITSLLVSPNFCYRVDLPRAGEVAAPADSPKESSGPPVTVPLSDDALASRLSYFLWASMPDEALLARAHARDLHQPEAITSEARRMLRDGRVRGLATEMCGNWLDFRRFEEHAGVDRERFPSFTNELREAMFEEPIRFFVDLVRENGSVLDLLFADHTFVNRVLARHYGMPESGIGPDQWVRIDGARKYGRGGLLPMSVFLTKNAPGLRTSPVKRGYWVVRRLLGEVIPPPPPTVPQLPADESKLGDLTLREALERHRQDKSCSGCHARFDSMGLAFEGYGPIGELREKDLGGHPVDARATYPGGGEGSGLDGLLAYLRERREKDFIDNFCRKLLAYALGRGLIPSDDALLDAMRAKLAASGYRFGSLVETIVASPQFLRKRGLDQEAKK